MAKYPICQRCNRPEDEHCPGFDPYIVPDGCQCDPRDWGDNKIKPICARFVGSPDENCEDCEHHIECHHKKGS